MCRWASGICTIILGCVVAVPLYAQIAPSPTPIQISDNSFEDNLQSPKHKTIYVSVWNKTAKSFVKGLNQNTFVLSSGRKPLEIDDFAETDETTTVGILLDISGSMQGPRSSKSNEIPSSVAGVNSFINKSNPQNQYFMFGVSDQPALLFDTTKDRDRIKNALIDVIKTKPHGNTSVYDAITLALDKMDLIREKKKILIVISDGVDNNSKNNNFGQIRKRVRESGILVYLINLVRSDEQQSLDIVGSSGKFDEIAKNTGGNVAYPTNENEMISAFELLADELRNQYAIEFRPLYGEEKKWHKLKVTLKKQPESLKITVIAPDGFYH